MNSVLIDLGIFQISWYSVFILLAIFIGGYLCLLEAKKFNLNSNFMVNLIFWMIILAVVGARLYYVAFNWSYYQLHMGEIYKIWEGGLAIHGAIIGALFLLIIYAHRYKVKLFLLTDIIVVSLIIGQAIGRWGNFFNQEAYGSVVSESFLKGVHIPEFIINNMYINGSYHHPTFLYESLWCILGFIVLLIVRRYKYLKLGQLTGVYFMWYAVGRFFIEGLRTDSLMFGTFKMAQVVSVILFLIGLMIVSVINRGSKFDNLYSAGGPTNGIKF